MLHPDPAVPGCATQMILGSTMVGRQGAATGPTGGRVYYQLAGGSSVLGAQRVGNRLPAMPASPVMMINGMGFPVPI